MDPKKTTKRTGKNVQKKVVTSSKNQISPAHQIHPKPEIHQKIATYPTMQINIYHKQCIGIKNDGSNNTLSTDTPKQHQIPMEERDDPIQFATKQIEKHQNWIKLEMGIPNCTIATNTAFKLHQKKHKIVQNHQKGTPNSHLKIHRKLGK